MSKAAFEFLLLLYYHHLCAFSLWLLQSEFGFTFTTFLLHFTNKYSFLDFISFHLTFISSMILPIKIYFQHYLIQISLNVCDWMWLDRILLGSAGSFRVKYAIVASVSSLNSDNKIKILGLF